MQNERCHGHKWNNSTRVPNHRLHNDRKSKCNTLRRRKLTNTLSDFKVKFLANKIGKTRTVSCASCVIPGNRRPASAFIYASGHLRVLQNPDWTAVQSFTRKKAWTVNHHVTFSSLLLGEHGGVRLEVAHDIREKVRAVSSLGGHMCGQDHVYVLISWIQG